MINKKGIYLDIACGSDPKDKRFFRMNDIQLSDNEVDLVWDYQKLPYPLEDGCCFAINAVNVVQRINPVDLGLIKIMNEWHRILMPNGRLMISAPYGLSGGYIMDPAAIKPVNENTWLYFAPQHPSGLWNQFRPAPWKIIVCSYHTNGALEVILEKIG